MPIRKAPPPPGTKIQHPHRFSLNALWIDKTSSKTPESPTNAILFPPMPGITITLNPQQQINELPIFEPFSAEKCFPSNNTYEIVNKPDMPLPPMPPPHKSKPKKVSIYSKFKVFLAN